MTAFQAELKTTAQDKGSVVRNDSGPRRIGF
jgi:5-(carboxyamino)imidazole ribonucleotide mutase